MFVMPSYDKIDDDFINILSSHNDRCFIKLIKNNYKLFFGKNLFI